MQLVAYYTKVDYYSGIMRFSNFVASFQFYTPLFSIMCNQLRSSIFIRNILTFSPIKISALKKGHFFLLPIIRSGCILYAVVAYYRDE